MNVSEEIREIVGKLKDIMIFNRDSGFSPPSLSLSTIDYMERGGKTQNYLDNLDNLKKTVDSCMMCRLGEPGARRVFGEGHSKARLIFVGSGPGQEEKLEGRPFVGEDGKLLTRIIEKGMGLTRDQVYICNVVKCCPPDNRDLKKDEKDSCLPYLKQQISLIKPEVICTLGRIAAQAFWGNDFKVTERRGKWHTFMNTPVMPTYHPAYILRKPAKERQLKSDVWRDIKSIMVRLNLELKT